VGEVSKNSSAKRSGRAVAAALCVFILAGPAVRRACSAVARPRIEELFDLGWKFFKGDLAGAERPDLNDVGWRAVDLPHDWSIEGPFSPDNPSGKAGGFAPLGVGWYRKHFRINPAQRGRKVFVQFDGVYKNSDVWINGVHVGKRWYGYIGFEYDLTEHIKWDSANVLAVRVDNSQQSCRWYSGSGIYRHVWLRLTDKLHVAHWGTYVTTPRVAPASAVVNVKTLVKNEHDVFRDCTLETIIFDDRGRRIALAQSDRRIAAGAQFEFSQDIEVPMPVLWSVESPYLYSAHNILRQNGKIVDTYVTPFGIREVDWDPNKGLLVNGKAVLLKGVCIHHDLGALGAAFHDRAMERRLEILKGIGCNAIRTSHNPPAPGLLDMCDLMGFLVIDEAFDKWGPPRHATWEQDWQKDLGSMIRRDRNHPAVILWSVGNEVGAQQSKQTQDKLRMLVDYVHRLDPTRKVTCGTFPQYVPNFVAIQDIAGLNYQEQWFDQYRKNDPNIIIVSTESYAYYRGKGDTHKAFYPMNSWFDVLRNGHVAGLFYWSGIDYLGESVAGWPLRGWNCSLIDTCGFPRPVSFFQQSFWVEEPLVRIAVMHESLDTPRRTKNHWGWPKMASHWTLPGLEGETVQVVTFTNCDSVELFLNGRSLGKKDLVDFQDGMIKWSVEYEPGLISAVARGPGRIVRLHELQTAGPPAAIRLLPDRPSIRADGLDLCHVEVNVVDPNGILVPDASHQIDFDLSGSARLLAVDNGDLASTEPYKADKRKAFSGRCLVILQSTGRPGRIRLAARSPALASAEVTITAN